MNRIVVYACIFGDYDQLNEIPVKDPNADYILFTDNPYLTSNTWDVWFVFNEYNARYTARLYKANPPLLIQKYDYTVWIDARFAPLVKDWKAIGLPKHREIMAFRHDVRDCAYQEAKVCYDMGLDTPERINNTVDFLKRMNYPKHNGLCSTGFLIRNNSPVIFDFNETWFTYIDQYCIRDQLTFNFTCHALQINIIQPPDGVNIYENPYLSKAKKHLKPRTI